MNFVKCFFGPRLYQTYKDGINPNIAYTPNLFENIGDNFIKFFRFCWSFTMWTSPFIGIYLYRRGTFSKQGLIALVPYGTSLSILLVVAVMVRAIGRAFSKEYMQFLVTLSKAQNANGPAEKELLAKYDFEFYAWPVDYRWRDVSSKAGLTKRRPLANSKGPRSFADNVKAVPCNILSYICASTFGRRMTYPGTTALINTLVRTVLMQGRAKLVEEKGGKRAKLQTELENELDTMFIDRRNNPAFPNGNVLVLCSEGNAGFYEIGCTQTPLEAGFSILGWNRPGFAESSGIPWPENNQAAIDMVVQYAINRLGFQPCDIVLFAWSIGGFEATYAASTYPEIRHVVLDATFDDIMPLAIARMPKSWENLVKLTVRKYINLNIAEQLGQYQGPVLLIRRSKDEMITTIDPTVIASNRGNDLLIKLLQNRYPNLFDDQILATLRDYLRRDHNGQGVYRSNLEIEDELCGSIFQSYAEENSMSFPMLIGEDFDLETKKKLVIYLASKHMIEIDCTHCPPLPAPNFTTPWQALQNGANNTSAKSAQL